MTTKPTIKSLSLRIDAQDETIAALLARIETLEARPVAPARKPATGKRGKGDQRLRVVADAAQPKMGPTSIDGWLTVTLTDKGIATRDELTTLLTEAIEGKVVKTTRDPKALVTAYASWAIRLGFVEEAPADAVVEQAEGTEQAEPEMEVILADEADRPTVVEEAPQQPATDDDAQEPAQANG